MHDIDHTLLEFEEEYDDYDDQENETEFEDEFEFAADSDTESPFDEGEEMELTADLLDVTNEAELDQFLGKLIKRASRKARRFMKSSTGRALGGVLKRAAKRVLPIAKRAIGGYLRSAGGGMPFGGSPVGGSPGGFDWAQLAPMARNLFGMELEGLSPEDQEFEVARKFVRFAGSAAKKTALAPSTIDPKSAVTSAVTEAARRHAPGLLKKTRPSSSAMAGVVNGGRSGKWIRRGRRIILMGV